MRVRCHLFEKNKEWRDHESNTVRLAEGFEGSSEVRGHHRVCLVVSFFQSFSAASV